MDGERFIVPIRPGITQVEPEPVKPVLYSDREAVGIVVIRLPDNKQGTVFRGMADAHSYGVPDDARVKLTVRRDSIKLTFLWQPSL